MFGKRREKGHDRPRFKPNRQALVAELGLRSEPHAAPLLRKALGLDGRLELLPIYTLTLDAGAELYFLDYDNQGAGVRGARPGWVSLLLILTRMPLSPVTLRVTRKRSDLAESFGASASGGRRVSLSGTDGFDETLSLYARDEAAAVRAITPSLRAAVLKALGREADDASFSLGEKEALLTLRSEAGVSDEVARASLEDLLNLYALLQRQKAAKP